jgi:signal transduction histidine kinase
LRPLPFFVRRAVLRVLFGGAIVALLAGVVGIVGERSQLGGSLESARARIATDVERQFSTLSDRLEAAVNAVAAEPTLLTLVQTRDGAATRGLFVRAAEAAASTRLPGVAITLYGPEGRPIAWSGRPAPIPIPRLSGPDALFLAPSGGLSVRIVRVKPVIDPAAIDRRVATIVAEAPLSATAGVASQTDGFLLDTSIVRVPLRTRFEGAPDAAANAIVVRSRSGEPIAVVDVPSSEIEAAHIRWQTRTAAAEAMVLAGVLLLLSGPLLDWRRMVRAISAHVAISIAILALLIVARAVLWFALRLANLADRPLTSPEVAGPYWIALASPFDFLFTALFVGGVVALLTSSFEHWRYGRRWPVRVLDAAHPIRIVAFVVTQLAAGLAVGGLVFAYESFLRTRLSQASIDVLHFSLHPVDVTRLVVVAGLLVLHAALAALAVLIFRAARSPWVFAPSTRWARALMPVFWAAPALWLLREAMRSWDRPPIVPAALVIAFAIAGTWIVRRYRPGMAHASQAARLTVVFLAFSVPSLIFYPSLVDAAGRARRQLVESRYAPEVINQRRNLQLQLTEAQAQIDSFPDLATLVSVGEPVVTGPPPTDAAFLAWSKTVLAEQRLTSSVELYDAAGSLVSRFALKLPESAGAQVWQEASCNWEVFEEVSPFFSEERRLLHAGRGICISGTNGRPSMVGSIVVHVQLDYSNLSFISARSPYVALLRAPGEPTIERTPRERLEFTVYGWSRRALYTSGNDAWPLVEDVFSRLLASRDPFWANLSRGGSEYEVYFQNDRGAIYALGHPLTGAFGHLMGLAEVLVLGVATMVVLLTGGALYGLIAARTPASGRALLREVRASFYRKLFIAFVIAAVLPVLALALLTREYVADLISTDVEQEATRTAASASRVVEDVGTLEARGGSDLEVVDDDLVVWLSRVIAQDVNIFDGVGLLASSERNLFVSGLLPTRTPGEVYRAILLEGRPSFVYRETVARYEYLVSAAPVRIQNRDAILTVPLTLRQQELESQTDELDRRVVLAAVLFIILGAAIGYWMAERIADPVNRLMKATARIARGDLDARILATSSDEFRRLVESFNRMAADLQRQRVELERTNRLAAWADMARQVAHDIKNPLTPIQLNAEHLRRVHIDRGEPLNGVLDECVSNILKQVRLLRQLASEFSSFASAPTARPTPTALHELIADVAGPYRTGLAGRVELAIDVPPTLPPALVDKTLLARALTNIIENALHAMPSGGTLSIRARALSDARLELAIADTGIGMDSSALARIFEPYFSTRAAGTGLGLTIAKRNVELNNGTIDVQSEKGKGTVVTLTVAAADGRT